MHPTRRGFSVIELLVVIAIIAVLVGILVPIIGASQLRAQIAQCTSNAGQIAAAMNSYLKDNRNYFPAHASLSEHEILIRSGVGFRDKYLSGGIDVFQCPLDNGDSLNSAWTTAFNSDPLNLRSSYLYIDNNSTAMKSVSGILAVEGHRGTEFSNPDKKVVILDTPMLATRPHEDPKNQWHNRTNPLKGGLGFMDGHAGEFARKTSGITANPASAPQISTMRNESFY